MNDIEAIELLTKNRLYTPIINSHDILKKYMETRYQDIPKNMFSYKEVRYRMINHIENRPICRVCGKPVNFVGNESLNICGKTLNGYRKTCSKECHYKDEASYQKYKESKQSRSEEKKQAENEKRKMTCLKKYGYENMFIVKKDKIKQIMEERYGGYTLSSEILKTKQQKTMEERYGNKNIRCTEYGKNKIKETQRLKNNGLLYSQTEEGRKKHSQNAIKSAEKRLHTIEKRYGNKYALNNPSIANKRLQTMRKNNTFNTSKIETQLKNYFDKNSIKYIYQYKSDQYPYNCDFYFPDNDLYLEIQGTWTHGYHPFNSENAQDLEILNMWKEKSKVSNYYKNAIKVWTINDVKKRKIAKDNNLNYLEIFSTNFNEILNILLNKQIII